ncbi:FtsX-like permease family protein [Melissospora conviva]|uniref:FtsX-like permease family protein n=1 Tax=Melissospora conviva TaxID=3388432 RepID=UPI003B81B1F2
MRLVLRRAREAGGLLLAALVAALVATTFVTALTEYNRQALDAGRRSVLAAAPVDETSLLITGTAGRGADEYTRRDDAVRAELGNGLGPTTVGVAAARHGTGRQLTGNLPATVTVAEAYATIGTLEGLAEAATLLDGAWPAAGRTPMQVAVPETVATALGLAVGDRVPLLDRATGARGTVVVTGVWRPVDPGSAYWRLAPAAVDRPTGSSYGPFVVDPADFDRTFTGTTSAAWLAQPNLRAVDPADLGAVSTAVTRLREVLPDSAGLGESLQITTGLAGLADRLGRADLVGRSALVTPLLLIGVLAGYSLLLLAGLLGGERRAQTALLRARGAARHQIVRLTLREAVLVVAPAVLLAPPLAYLLLRGAAATGLTGVELDPGILGGALPWWVALAAGAGCLLAMLAPDLRNSGERLLVEGRPARWAAAQRAGADLLLVGLALLAWLQLRQYAASVIGLGIDPLLAAAPTLGVLAGAVLALRLLPAVTRLAERLVGTRQWPGAMLGTWQAGRRPHAGPVLLLALAVGASTLAWSLLDTWENSQTDQAGHRVGADLRLTEVTGDAPTGRAAELAALTGVQRALPGWRENISVGSGQVPATLLAVDAAAAGDVLLIRSDLAEPGPQTLLDTLVRHRSASTAIPLAAGSRQLSGTVAVTAPDAGGLERVAVSLVLTAADGIVQRLPVAELRTGAPDVPFAVDLPDLGGRQQRLAGFEVTAADVIGPAYRLELGRLRVDAAPLELPAAWAVADATGQRSEGVTTGGAGVSAPGKPEQLSRSNRLRFMVIPAGTPQAVPAVVTPAVSAELRVGIGDVTRITLAGTPVEVRIAAVAQALPSAGAGPGVLLDLPSAVEWLIAQHGTVRPQPEWWLSVADADHETVAAELTQAGVTVADRVAETGAAARDPYWLGVRTGLLAAALGAILLALVGLAVDAWANGRRRVGELAVLHALGADHRTLRRSLLTEQLFLAVLGVLVGLGVGAGVAAVMAPLVILDPSAARPAPEALFSLPWPAVGLTAVAVLALAALFSAAVTASLRARIVAAQSQIGGER